MPETHTSKSTAPDGESSEKPIIIGYPVPGSELPSTEELGTSEEKARLELLGKVSVGLGRSATGRQLDVSGASDRAIDRARRAFLMSQLHPDTPAYLLTENTEDGSDDDNSDGSRRATWVRVDRGDFSTTINPDSEENHGLPPAEDALNAWKAQLPQSNNQPTEQPKPPTDERERLRAVLRAAGKLNPKKAEPKPSTREDVLAALRGATTGANKPVPRSQAREEVLAALRGGIIEETDSDRDPSVADTESESPALEDQEESGSSNEQDDSPDELSADKQSLSASEVLKALAEADDTRICIRNMSDAAERIVRTLKRSEIPLSSNNNLQEFASGVSTMLNRLDGVVEEARNGLPLDEAAHLGDMGDRIGEIKHALTALNNAVAEQGRYGHSNENYLPYAMKLRDSITELQRFMNVLVEHQENKEQG